MQCSVATLLITHKDESVWTCLAAHWVAVIPNVGVAKIIDEYEENVRGCVGSTPCKQQQQR